MAVPVTIPFNPTFPDPMPTDPVESFMLLVDTVNSIPAKVKEDLRQINKDPTILLKMHPLRDLGVFKTNVLTQRLTQRLNLHQRMCGRDDLVVL